TLKSAQIDGLETTLEQAFFYYTASVWCTEDSVRSDHLAEIDPHSAGNIRVNAAVSLMPEFSRTFQCKEGDPMYIEDKDSCYIFGPKYKMIAELREASMAQNLLLLLILLQSVASDRLRYHLEHLIDKNVSACDDFYHHVCSQKVDPTEFFQHRAPSIFADAVARLRPEAVMNSPID
ncbi:hypothetical protein PENTCL1PPCAC_28746, partial [Pristionchus entomophagus]